MEARLKDFVETLTPGQLLALFMKGDGVMTDLAASARLRPEQIGMLVRLMEESNPSWSPDVAYQLIANQECTPGQLERLIGWCDDPGTWLIACEKHPGGEHALVRTADPYIALRYAPASTRRHGMRGRPRPVCAAGTTSPAKRT